MPLTLLNVTKSVCKSHVLRTKALVWSKFVSVMVWWKVFAWDASKSQRARPIELKISGNHDNVVQQPKKAHLFADNVAILLTVQWTTIHLLFASGKKIWWYKKPSNQPVQFNCDKRYQLKNFIFFDCYRNVYARECRLRPCSNSTTYSFTICACAAVWTYHTPYVLFVKINFTLLRYKN